MKRITTLLAVFTITLWLVSPPSTCPQEKPNTCNWEVYFSPHGGATDAIIRELDKAKSTVPCPSIDDETVITGSFNFTKAAEENNAENLLVIHDKKLAERYIKNWKEHERHSDVYAGRGK